MMMMANVKQYPLLMGGDIQFKSACVSQSVSHCEYFFLSLFAAKNIFFLSDNNEKNSTIIFGFGAHPSIHPSLLFPYDDDDGKG